MIVPKHDDNTGLECWNSDMDLIEAMMDSDRLVGHPHCSLCCDLGEAWQALKQATAEHLARAARDAEAFKLEWRQGRPPRQKPGKQ